MSVNKTVVVAKKILVVIRTKGWIVIYKDDRLIKQGDNITLKDMFMIGKECGEDYQYREYSIDIQYVRIILESYFPPRLSEIPSKIINYYPHI